MPVSVRSVLVSLLRKCGRRLARYLNRPRRAFASPISGGLEADWRNVVEPGDVLLIEGTTRVSTAIRYITQSSWSHAALYVGHHCADGSLIEADMEHGVIAVANEKYAVHNVRICRPHGLGADDLGRVVEFAIAHLGDRYDLKNVFDLVRYLIPTPPVPTRFRRRLLSFGSGEPTQAICSSLIAKAFQLVKYPILPESWWSSNDPEQRHICYQVRHHSRFPPRDFDLSPYFEIIKPTLAKGFDHRELTWEHTNIGQAQSGASPSRS